MKLTELNEKEILDIVKPLAEHTENSWNKKSYREFCRYLAEDLEQGFSEQEFNRQIHENYDKYGLHKISGLLAVHRNPDNVVVMWNVDFEKRKEPGLLVYSFKEQNGEICIKSCSYHA